MTILNHFKNIEFMIEDNIKFAEQVAREGYKVYLLNNNMPKNEDLNIVNVSNLKEIYDNI